MKAATGSWRALAVLCVVYALGPSARAQELGPAAGGFQHPCMYLNAAELEQIRDRIRTESLARSIFTSLVADAEALLSREPQPVAGAFRNAIEPPVTAEGDAGPPTDAQLAQRDFRMARNLGIVYALTAEERYAQKVVAIATAWMESMEPVWPRTEMAWQRLTETLPALLYAVDLCWNSEAVTPEFLAAFQEWTRALVQPAVDLHDFATAFTTAWNLNCIGAAAVICEDPEWLRMLHDHRAGNHDTFQNLFAGSVDPVTREPLPGLFDASGQSAYEINKTDAVPRAVHVLKALTYVAELARHHGQDLYSFEHRGRGLKRSLLFYARQFDGTESTARTRSPFKLAQDPSVYELAYARYGAPEFGRVVSVQGRLAVDSDVLGPVSLTHGAPVALNGAP